MKVHEKSLLDRLKDYSSSVAVQQTPWLDLLMNDAIVALNWQPIDTAPDLARDSRVRLGQHLGKLMTLGDGSLIAIWHEPTTGLPKHWLSLSRPPR
jgi:hypothetical protein